MFLKEFKSSDVQRYMGKVLDTAATEPVIIHRQAKEGLVLLSKSEYAKLVKAAQ